TWSESGAGALSLAGPSHTNRSTQADGGVRFSRIVGRVRPFVDARYRAQLGARNVTSTNALTDSVSGVFTVEGTELAPHNVSGEGGVTFFTNRFDFSLIYQLQASPSPHRQTFHFGVGF